MTHTVELLDNPVWHALANEQANFALGDDLARRFPSSIGPFAAVATSDRAAFDHLAALIPAGETIALVGGTPAGEGDNWTQLRQPTLIQMVYEGIPVNAPEADEAITPLASVDTAAMLQLVALTHPGPFEARTIELGCYLAVRQDGQLAAMAGERLHLPGYREISAVCTHPDFQRRGYARRLVQRLVQKIREEGDTPILHVVSGNAGALALYESLGFRVRAELPLYILRRQ